MSRTAIDPSQITSTSTRTTAAGSQSSALPPDSPRERAARDRLNGDGLRAHGVTASRSAAEMQRLAHARHELEVPRLLARLCRARVRQVDVDDVRDAARARRHDDDARREEDRLGDRVRDEDDRAQARLPDAQELACSGARVSSRRARRTARPSAAAPARTRARARSRRAAACRPRAATDGGRRSPCSSTSSSISSTRLLRRARSQPSISSGSAMFFATVRQSKSTGVLEDDAVVVVGARPRRRLAVHRHRAARRRDQVADDAQQRRLAAAGGADQRDELAGLDREVDVLQRDDVAALEALRQALDLDDVRHATCSGARVTTSFSASDDDEEERDAERGRDDVRRPEVLRARACSTG